MSDKISIGDQEIQNVASCLSLMDKGEIVACIFVDADGVLNIQSKSGKINIGKMEK